MGIILIRVVRDLYEKYFKIVLKDIKLVLYK